MKYLHLPARNRPSRLATIGILLNLTLIAGAHVILAGENDEWPGWRGQNMDATVTQAGVLQAGQNYQLKVVWRQTIGTGYSGVSVADGAAVTMFSDGSDDYISALNAETGAELWRFRIDSTYLGRFGSQNGPLSTPLIADGKVFALSPKGLLFALDFSNGQKLWSTNLVAEHGSEAPFYGFTTSPLLRDNVLIVETGGDKHNAITAFNPDTGEVLWATGDDKVHYQSPAILDLNSRTQLLCVGSKYVYGMVPESGEILWQYEHKGSGGSAGAGGMSPILLPDNKIFLTHKSTESVLLQLAGTDGKLSPAEVWHSKGIRRNYAVPVYYDGYLYGYNGAFLSCVDAATGKSVWKSRQPGDGFPIVVDGHLVVTTKKGGLSIGAVSLSGYAESAKLKLFGDLCWAPPSFANGRIYARSHGEIACVEILPTDAVATADEQRQGIISGSKFAQFVAGLAKSPNKKASIDKYLAQQKHFPIIEGRDLVHFVVRHESKEVALGGELFGYEGEQPMNHVAGTDLFYYSARLEPDAYLGYEFIDDSLKHFNDPQNLEAFRIPWVGRMSMLAMPEWQAPDHLTAAPHQSSGRLDSLTFASKITDSTRTLLVYLPRGYDAAAASYPVAYVHGRIGDGKLPVTLDNLIGKTVAPVVVVFVPPTFRGGYGEYIGSGRDTYARAFVEEIVPLVEKNYRIKTAPGSRANIGSMNGGFMAFYTAFKNPGMFGGLGMQSPYWDPDESGKHGNLLVAGNNPNLTIYLDWGKYDARAPLEGWDLGEYSEMLSKLLLSNGYHLTGGEVNQGFGQVSWRNRSDKLFETLFPIDDRAKDATNKVN